MKDLFLSHNKKKQGFLIIISSIIALILIATWTNYIRYSDGENLNNNLGYAIGTYGGRTPAGGNIKGTTTGNNIFFSYIVGNQKIENIKTLALQKNTDDTAIGKQYLVVYDTTNLEHAAILFDYPIKDSIMFIKYKKEFSEKPLNLTPYFRAPIVFYLKDYPTNK